MNAIVALCHFCEAHGPRAIFCTYSGCGSDVATATPTQSCTACGSLGAETVLVSRPEDGATYYSREALPSAELTALLRQAAIRSLTCEVSWSKEGGCVYFSEGTSCHVLGCSFQLSDSRARGLRRWFSSLVLMRDRLQLLNVMPFFSEHMQLSDSRARGLRRWFSSLVLMRDRLQLLNVMPFFSEQMQKSATELQELTAKVFEEEQRVCSQRALRLNTGRNDFGPSRSLQQLTGEENIFHKLHMTYTWMLHAGARTYTETLYTSRDLLSQLDPDALRGSIFSPGACSVGGSVPLRGVRDLLGADSFRVALYCTLTGIELLLKWDGAGHTDVARALTDLLPASPVSSTGQSVSHVRRVGLADATRPTAGRCVLRQTDDGNVECSWPANLPAKCPTLMSRIESAMSNTKLTDAILEQQIKALQLEWLGIAHTLKNAMRSSGAWSTPVAKLRQALGVTPHDELLLHYWIQTYCV